MIAFAAVVIVIAATRVEVIAVNMRTDAAVHIGFARRSARRRRQPIGAKHKPPKSER